MRKDIISNMTTDDALMAELNKSKMKIKELESRIEDLTVTNLELQRKNDQLTIKLRGEPVYASSMENPHYDGEQALVL